MTTYGGEVSSTALAQFEAGGQVATNAGGGVAAISQTMDALKAVRTFVKGEFKSGQDYGVIPGTGKKATLLLPGAQKACMYFNCYAEYQVTTHELGGGHAEYQVNAILVSRTTGMRVGAGLGLCSTMESKYRFRNAAKSCPQCGREAIIKGKAEYGGGWLCFAKNGGCGAKFKDGDPAVEAQESGKVENGNPHDQRNTALKMAKKRALVDAAMGLGCLSELFTQDLEDVYDLHATPPDDGHDEPAPAPHAAPQQAQQAAPRRAPAEPPARADRTQQAPPKGQYDDKPPKTGGQLYAWSKKKEDAHGVAVIKPLDAWAKQMGFPYRMKDWNDDEVRDGFAKACEILGPGRVRGVAPAPPAEPHDAGPGDAYEGPEAEAGEDIPF